MGRMGLAWGGIFGPVTFVFAWAVGGVAQERYSPTDDAISELAALDGSARALMTVGLAGLGAGMLLFAAALRACVGRPAYFAATVTGLATLGVAATPLGLTAAADDLHAAFAVTGYLSLVAIPLLAARRLKRPRLARLSLVVGIVSGMCLVGAVLGLVAPGLLQRAGLTLVHAWVVAIAASLLWYRSPSTPE